MSVNQKRSKRKATGGRYKKSVKVLCNLGRLPASTRLGERRCRVVRGRGGNRKNMLLVAKSVNVLDPKTKKSQIIEIKTIVENPANRHFVRRNIITKGAIVETEMGRVRITSRPGQEGTLNGILV